MNPPITTDAQVVLFVNNLTPSQGRALERSLEKPIVDRSEVILDTFETHARRHESMLQVELARLRYFRTPLKRMWIHLERMGGGGPGGRGAGRGPGEKQLETDRRQIQTVHNIPDEFGIRVKNVLLVLSKVDRVEDQSMVDVLWRHYEDTVTNSAATGMGLDRLAKVISERLSGGFAEIEIEASVGSGRLLAWLTQHAEELSRSYTDETSTRVRMRCRIPRQAMMLLRFQEGNSNVVA